MIGKEAKQVQGCIVKEGENMVLLKKYGFLTKGIVNPWVISNHEWPIQRYSPIWARVNILG
ncbi:hypothetical protein H9636_12550 [Ureibacillus sp. Re31]|uniref:Uncharacterized protein n=1 Tax=Ureibacillus galli TaxID=2762222 RepID=A0ABR8XE19_9BACL|nr:hypothetical protein [Ureibacillus galli]